MDFKLILVAHTLIAGACGIPARLYVAAFRLSTESISSPKTGVRYGYRYLIFSLYYMISFMVTPLLLKPFIAHFKAMEGDAKSYLYFLFCLPLASLLYYLDYKFIVWTDAPKLRAREQLRKKRL